VSTKTRRCEGCGGPIGVDRRANAKTCSTRCKRRVDRRHERANRTTNRTTIRTTTAPLSAPQDGPFRAPSATQTDGGFADVSTDVPASSGLLSRWRFRDPETHSVQTLVGLWPGQATFWKLAHEHDRLIGLKGRQVGLTTVVLAVVAEHFLTTPNAQVNVLSREEGSALDLLERVRFGLAALGVAFDRETFSVLETGTDSDDRRVIEAFTSARDATRGRTASLVLLDEWAAMMDPARVLRAVEPTSPRIIILFKRRAG
jgi:hypothetical protein